MCSGMSSECAESGVANSVVVDNNAVDQKTKASKREVTVDMTEKGWTWSQRTSAMSQGCTCFSKRR